MKNEIKKIETTKVELKKVLCGDVEKDLTIEIVPFNRRNDDHVDFALAVADFYGRMPSNFQSITDAAQRCVELFVKHTGEQADDPNSDYSYVHADKRASRIIFNNPAIQKAIADFLTLA